MRAQAILEGVRIPSQLLQRGAWFAVQASIAIITVAVY
jgi:hypothetical protein